MSLPLEWSPVWRTCSPKSFYVFRLQRRRESSSPDIDWFYSLANKKAHKRKKRKIFKLVSLMDSLHFYGNSLIYSEGGTERERERERERVRVSQPLVIPVLKGRYSNCMGSSARLQFSQSGTPTNNIDLLTFACVWESNKPSASTAPILDLI